MLCLAQAIVLASALTGACDSGPGTDKSATAAETPCEGERLAQRKTEQRRVWGCRSRRATLRLGKGPPRICFQETSRNGKRVSRGRDGVERGGGLLEVIPGAPWPKPNLLLQASLLQDAFRPSTTHRFCCASGPAVFDRARRWSHGPGQTGAEVAPPSNDVALGAGDGPCWIETAGRGVHLTTPRMSLLTGRREANPGKPAIPRREGQMRWEARSSAPVSVERYTARGC